ncbi:xylose import ATP-binding protein XylG (plasmid) [Arthrobacter sp. Hiyo8]|uniref:sugar ABC transporter ATP-binding protein n=1 Tax=Arthrobacter sp. Hiyo1 TaxID=1588020 RepID=UPI000683B0D7|nr:sugar ABC transporter ATP-binding protein [Arthrobacter sp. Hiyo1]BAS18324.1 xylose import ATP-binding protein XylG [Arthrobacter sp. Hiyo8]GAP60853.1 xylose import ATP-binding protein XylG [Arthrobacter sp. Hiyo1]
MNDKSLALEMKGISKSFPSGQVLFDVDLNVRPGSVHGLLGQNGAGKSTLMKILGGIYPDYKGEVFIGSEPIRFTSVSAAMKAGVTVIHQEFSLIPKLTVAENILLGREPLRGGLIDRSKLLSEAQHWLDEFGISLPLESRVDTLGVAQQQITEIMKAVSRSTRVLVMDEPTARLPEPDREVLFAVIRKLVAQGVAIVYISHFLDEVQRICDEVTVLRDGRKVGFERCQDLDVGKITKMMVGNVVDRADPRIRPDISDSAVLLEARNISQLPYLKSVNLTVRKGEIVALVGLVGASRTRLARCIAGAEKLTAGELRIEGRSLRIRRPAEAISAGITMVPEDRKTQGLILGLPAFQNLILTGLTKRFHRYGMVRKNLATTVAKELFEALQIHPLRPELPAGSFSGGNQQKIVLAKAIAAQSRLLILDQPTAGVDVVTKAEIHTLIDGLAAEGKGVILVSDDVDEVLRLAHRVLVMGRGEIVSEHLSGDLNQDDLNSMIANSRGSALSR